MNVFMGIKLLVWVTSNMVLISKVLPQLSWLVVGIPLGNINSCNRSLLTITQIK